MKFGIYFEYCFVLFYDILVDVYFLIGFIVEIDKIYIYIDGKIYFYVMLDVFSVLYLVYIGEQCKIKSEGCVVGFNKCFVGFVGGKGV